VDAAREELYTRFMRRALVAAVATLAVFACVPGAAAAAPCPPEIGARVGLGARSQIAFDRQATVEVYGRPLGASVVPSDVRIDFIDDQGHGFFSHAFASADIPGIAPETWRHFPIQLGEGDPPVVVRLSYTQQGLDQPVACEVVEQQVVSGFPGLTPSFELVAPPDFGRASLTVRATDGCATTPPQSVRVVVSHRGRQAARRVRDFCDLNSRWRARGTLPRLHFRTLRVSETNGRNPSVRELSLLDASHLSRTSVYRVEVFWGDRLVLRRWALARTVRDSYRTYAEPYCRRLGKKLYRDRRGEHYCREPDWNHWLTLHRTPPKE
jgi:hypothetical protein